MKKANRKLIPAISMLVISAIALTSATYAWFTMSTKVTVNTFDVTATAPANVEISLGGNRVSNATGNICGVLAPDSTDGDYWTIGTVKIDAQSTKNYDGRYHYSHIKPSSSVDGVNGHFYAALPTALDNSGFIDNAAADPVFEAVNLEAPKNATTVFTDDTAAGYYLDIPIWVRTTGSTDVNLSVSNVTITNKLSQQADLTNAVRLSFLTDDGTANALKEKTNVATAYSKSVFGIDQGVIVNSATGVNAADVAAQKFQKTSEMIIEKPVVAVLPKKNPGDTYAQSKCFVLRIWIEGQQAKAISANAGSSFSIGLDFGI